VYLITSSIRYSGLALSEVSPVKLSYDAVAGGLDQETIRP